MYHDPSGLRCVTALILLVVTMINKIFAANAGAFKVIAAQAPNMVRAALPSARLAVPIGGFVLWASWPASGETVKETLFGSAEEAK